MQITNVATYNFQLQQWPVSVETFSNYQVVELFAFLHTLLLLNFLFLYYSYMFIKFSDVTEKNHNS